MDPPTASSKPTSSKSTTPSTGSRAGKAYLVCATILCSLGLLETTGYCRSNSRLQIPSVFKLEDTNSSRYHTAPGPSSGTATSSSQGTSYWTPPLSDFEFCESHNFIPIKDDEELETTQTARPRFSMQPSDFAPQSTKICSTTQQVKDAIRYGLRVFDDPSIQTPLQKRYAGANYTPSKFLYHDCDLPMLPPPQLCDTINQFSKIIYQGDSLSRHAHYGLMMALSNDLIRGSAIQACQCDGQFSNNDKCITGLHYKANAKPYQYHVCSHLPLDNQVEVTFNINRLQKGVYKLNQDSNEIIDCSQPDQKPVLLILQGGVQLGYNGMAVYDTQVQPFFRDPVIQTCIQHQKFYLIFCLSSQQAPFYDEMYPAQTRNQTAIFDQEMERQFTKHYIRNAHFIHWANFTEGVQWTDGFHLAAQGNYFKSAHTFHLANAILQEKLALKHPEFTPAKKSE
ncbi:expressed unknown protein [Seminavis robusta]|uniref:Uncharacterized protein n=1 Tax=Seminavis robusta TaxID=568900 RepID=A0A9N8F1T7_9STRA|nr:expressed unknown protein [Seminavis robusta]|eukprot:Sro2693_g334830.1 n/a (453) ;mRNA; f:7872-9230